MSQADELLNSLTEEPTEIEEESKFIVIDDDRFMQVPERLKKLAVQFDHDMEVMTFDAPRYWDGKDMSQMSIWINYMREDGYMDAAPGTNVIVSPDDENRMRFDWTISRNVSEIMGQIQALVCVKKCDAAGNEENHWNSELFKEFYVSEGLECESTAIAPYSDIVEYLLLRVATVENKTTKAAMLRYVEQYLDEDPSVIIEHIEAVIADKSVQEFVDDYLDSYIGICTTENRVLENCYAGSYEMVSVEGKSEQAQYEGYQLLDYNNEYLGTNTAGGATVTNNGDGSFTVSGNGELTSAYSKYYYYTLADSAKLFKAGKLYLKVNGAATVPKMYIHPQVNNTSLSTMTIDGITEFEITQDMIDSDTFRVVVGMYGESGDTIVPGTFSAMLYQDGDGETEPFTGGKPSPSPEYPQEIKSVGTEVTVGTSNMNLLDVTTENRVVGGITLTNNRDGSVTVTGTATTEVVLNLGDVPGSRLQIGETYRVVGEGVGGRYNSKNGGTKYGVKFTVTDDVEVVRPYLQYKSGVTVNTTIWPMLVREIDKDKAFVKHEESSATISLVNPIRSVDDTVDIICKKDYKWGVERHVGVDILDGSKDYVVSGVEDVYSAFYTWLGDATLEDSNVLCDKLLDSTNTTGGERINKTGGYTVYIRIANEHLTSLDLEGFEAWITENPLKVQYRLATPTWEPLDSAAHDALESLQVYDGVTHVFVENTDVQPVITSNYGTSKFGARVITQAKEIDILKKQIGDINAVLESVIGGE